MTKIIPKNESKIIAAINAEQRRCRARLSDMYDVRRAVELAKEHPVVAVLPLPSRVGIRAVYRPGYGGSIANSYKGIPEETTIEIVRRASGWFFVAAKRQACVYSERVDVKVPQEAADEATRRFLDTVQVV